MNQENSLNFHKLQKILKRLHPFYLKKGKVIETDVNYHHDMIFLGFFHELLPFFPSESASGERSV
jgi:hypothetical protein